MDRTDQSLIAIRRILRSTQTYGRELARAAGLTPVQIRVLQIVAETGAATPKDISQRMRVSPPTMTSLLDRLAAKGMVERQKSEVDRRQKNVVITRAGRDAVHRAPDPLQQRYVSQFESLQDWEQAMIVAALERVAAMLDATDFDAAPVLDSNLLDDGEGGTAG
ncbi:MarR family winged helix-turn-helix transcriptional regulator [Roseitranquillus sediminis]|uniref:MarR family winged helix-turn-helix transcriptional regulator n=1 Tax=Roseitranquillus sediminis TaxID=2809051 RepID=UPI001D0C0C21|nr:MarR family transcriptional regulator [Roseitranquillus sediminis]MBM9596367.1 MarR family transcriptional regulator [Roseitranquillus sediminis]